MYTVFEVYKGSEKRAIFSDSDKMACARFEEEKREEYRQKYGNDFFSIIDCYTRSDEELEEERRIAERWDRLTEEQKNETIEADGKTYIKAIYEANHPKK